MPEKTTLIIACGGTGGHLFPGIAIAEAWEAAGGHALLLISRKSVDAQASEKYGELDFETIPAVAKPATFSPKMFPFLLKLWKTHKLCKTLLKKHRARAVIGMGGFTSMPPVQAGHSLGLPTYVHDSNALPGKANRLTARWCRSVLLGMKEAAVYFKKSDCRVTGSPVRKELDVLPERATAAAKWGLDPEKRTILVMGGSQGALALNTMITEAAKDAPELQFLHLTGMADSQRIAGLIDGRAGYRVVDFCDDMAAAYAACDIAVCRSGASSLCELAHIGMPALLVPYPYAADDHQTKNAEVFSQAGACELRQESELTTAGLVAQMKSMLDPQGILNPGKVLPQCRAQLTADRSAAWRQLQGLLQV